MTFPLPNDPSDAAQRRLKTLAEMKTLQTRLKTEKLTSEARDALMAKMISLRQEVRSLNQWIREDAHKRSDQNAKLRAENAELRAENEQLRAEVLRLGVELAQLRTRL